MRRSLAARLTVLGALYLVQGLPFGFQATALPVLLRRQGTSLEAIGLAGILALPWMLKVLFGPTVDAYHVARLGRRRSWILPLQVGLALCALGAALVDPERQLTLLLALVFAMNLCAATMDVAVDGLAVDLLREEELGPGNAAQVVGFKLGMLTSGGLLLYFVAQIGWRGLFAVVTGLVMLVFALTWAWREPDVTTEATPTRLRDVIDALRRAAAKPGTLWVLLFIGTYKLGESAADAMFKPFLVDAGFTDAQIGLWVGTWGTVASLLGSLAGGLLAMRAPLVRAVAIAAALRALPMLGQWAIAVTGPTEANVIAVTCTEHFFGGVLTTTMFAFMMSRVDREIGATHYTALATVEVAGKAPAGLLSGVLATRVGYAGVFGIGAGLAVAFLGLLIPIRRIAERDPARLPATRRGDE